MAMKINTGKVAFPIEFDNGEKDVIYINPNDREFLKELLQLGNRIEARLKNINLEKYKEVLNDGIDIEVDVTKIENVEQLSEERLKSLQNKLLALTEIDAEYQEVVKTELNAVFKSDISSIVFKYCQPLDYVIVEKSGKTESIPFINHFIEELAGEFQRYDEKRRTAMDKHIGKYKK